MAAYKEFEIISFDFKSKPSS